MEAQAKQELERISGLTAEQAKAELVASIEEEAKVDIARRYRELEAQAKDDADKKAREYVVNAIQ
ncbi:MAG: DUF3552 domain-containing protein, partial [Lachnospiraceae bacterium]|nr:DUF3552 domain-containing protein [Lachnospiraceae bacterium]